MTEQSVKNKLDKKIGNDIIITAKGTKAVSFFLFAVLSLTIFTSGNMKLYATEVEDLSAENDEGNENNSEKQKENDDTEKDNHIEIGDETRDTKAFKSDIEDKEDTNVKDMKKDMGNLDAESTEQNSFNSVTLKIEKMEGDVEYGPDSDCLFDPSSPHCASVDGKCPDGFNMNEDEQCFPSGPCPKGYESHDDDESGICHPIEKDDCPEGWINAKPPLNPQLGCLPDTVKSNEVSGHSTSKEICDNGIDDDGDGILDVDDPDCSPFIEICNNGLDDDGDGKVDAKDSDCVDCPDGWIKADPPLNPQLECLPNNIRSNG